MIIAMAISMSGGRDDDRPWPGIRVPFEVTDEEGAGLVRWGHATDLTALGWTLDQVPPHMRLPGTAHVPAPAPVSLPSETAAGPADNPPPDEPLPAVHDLPEDPRPASMTQPVDTEMLGVDDLPEPPKPSDPKQAWFDYALTQGLTGKGIDDVTKADLMSQYGGRL
jgi:hypothetical protein